MNSTIEKFGYPASLVEELEYWLILLRPAQVTLGSLVLAAKSDAIAYGDLPQAAFTEQKQAIEQIERALIGFVRYERINYLMLMMVDPHVHFHVIPRYSEQRNWNGLDFADMGWPGSPRLDAAVTLDPQQLSALTADMSTHFRSVAGN